MRDRLPYRRPVPVLGDLAATAPGRQSWRAALAVHPAAELFPLMLADELRDLGEDIQQNGLTTPIALWRADPKSPAQLLDGRNRLDGIEAATGCQVQVVLEAIPRSHTTVWTIKAGDWINDEKVIVLDGRLVDPYSYVISVNIHRRHLSTEQRRELIGKLLRADPGRSDRQIGKQIRADNKTVAAVRSDLERREEIPHVETRTDSTGREQPATKPPTSKTPTKGASGKAPSTPGARVEARDRRRADLVRHTFEMTLMYIGQICEGMSDMVIPPDLSTEDAAEAITTLTTSMALIEQLWTRLASRHQQLDDGLDIPARLRRAPANTSSAASGTPPALAAGSSNGGITTMRSE
jgi:hypothetical protein